MSGTPQNAHTSRRHGPRTRKLARTTRPTGQERFFDRNDIIVSKTDTKGRLTYVNRIFMAISDYEEAELLGKPHSIIRHPDMPRAIYRLMWERLQAGHEIFAYVKNLASDGGYYWTFAHVTPSFGAGGEIAGYHSSRRVPDRRIVTETITPLYRTLRAIEDSEQDRRAGLAKSSAHLAAMLKGKGLDYDELIPGL